MKLNYCTECAASLTKLNDTDYVCANGHKYYNNPHASCSIVLLNDRHEILVAERAREPKKGQLGLPGGFLNYDEDGYQGAQREAKEELGITVDLSDLEPIDCSLHHYLENDTACGVAFLCRKWRGELKPGDDVSSFEWKAIDCLNSPEFAWPYPYLYNKLRTIIDNELPRSN